MLRPVLGSQQNVAGQERPCEPAAWRVSSGTAAALGLQPAALAAAPTTAYLMLGDRCAADCAFCAQARTSQASADQLSRVAWPLFDADTVVRAIASAHGRGEIRRACFQVTQGPGSQAAAREAVATLAGAAKRLPICVSIAACNLEEIEMLLDAGAERVTLALDAATAEAYARNKGGSWERAWALLHAAARRFPERIGTHLIAGLGESEEELLNTAQALLRLGLTVGLFALTPVRGTRLEGTAAPPLASYRRIQAGLWLLKEGLSRVEEWRFVKGRLVDFGAPTTALAIWLAGGDAFRTAGCLDCNRPYYNERPSGPLYNYPRPLMPAEAEAEIATLLCSLAL